MNAAVKQHSLISALKGEGVSAEGRTGWGVSRFDKNPTRLRASRVATLPLRGRDEPRGSAVP
jgi:hypothetical protein